MIYRWVMNESICAGTDMKNSLPLIAQPPLPPMPHGVEILIARSWLRNTGVLDGHDHVEDSHHVTVLVSFDPSDAERRTMRTMAADFVTAACSFMSAPPEPDFGERLAQLLEIHADAFLNIAIALPTFSTEIALNCVQQDEGRNSSSMPWRLQSCRIG